MQEKEFLEKVRHQVKEALAELDGVLALRADHGGAAPHLFLPGDDLADLVVTPRYPMALTLDMLLDAWPEARLGVVARGCDERAVIELAKRQQVDLERVRIIGIPCTAEEAAECRCDQPYPQNLVVGERVEGVEDDRLPRFEAMPIAERREFWQHQFAKCLKCYGCRNICPECFCEACALEEDIWVERGVLAPPFPSYHLIRAMHMAGRCVACRQCELTCPADIPLTVIYSFVHRDVADRFGYIPGQSVDDKPPLSLALEGE